MPEQFSGVVVNELRRLDDAINDVVALLRGKNALTQSERAHVRAAYTALKEELRRLTKTGTVGGVRRKPTHPEDCFFEPAVRQALIALYAPTNSNPISSSWVTKLYEASGEITYHLNRLEKTLK